MNATLERVSIDDIIDHVAALGGVLVLRPQPGDGSPQISWGDAFFYYAPDGQVPATQPFATIVTKGYPDEPRSGRDRSGGFRLNIAVPAARFHQITGSTPQEAASEAYDASVPDAWFPHPVYGRAGWLCVVDPDEHATDMAMGLLDASHQAARARFERRSTDHRGG